MWKFLFCNPVMTFAGIHLYVFSGVFRSFQWCLALSPPLIPAFPLCHLQSDSPKHYKLLVLPELLNPYSYTIDASCLVSKAHALDLCLHHAADDWKITSSLFLNVCNCMKQTIFFCMQVIHLKHTLELVSTLLEAIKCSESPLLIAYTAVMVSV